MIDKTITLNQKEIKELVSDRLEDIGVIEYDGKPYYSTKVYVDKKGKFKVELQLASKRFEE